MPFKSAGVKSFGLVFALTVLETILTAGGSAEKAGIEFVAAKEEGSSVGIIARSNQIILCPVIICDFGKVVIFAEFSIGGQNDECAGVKTGERVTGIRGCKIRLSSDW